MSLHPFIAEVTDRAGNARAGAVVHIYEQELDGSPGPLAATFNRDSSPGPNPIQTDALGKARTWLEDGLYLWTFAFGGFTSDPEPWEATPGQPGPPGPKGDPGDPGPMGPKGDKGDQGDAGPAGAAGAAGPAGPKGDQGDIGPPGPAGPKGDQGDVGPAGAQGVEGPAGAVGPAGPKGDTGDVGPVGPAGPKGDAGAAGPAGPKGDTGDVGPAGPKGDQGIQGPPGPKVARTTLHLLVAQAIGGNATVNGQVAQRGMRAIRMIASAKCRLRFYATDAARLADVNRAVGTDPSDGAGVLMDVVVDPTDATNPVPLDFTLDRAIDLHSQENDGHLPFAVSTLDANAINLTLDLVVQATED